MPGKGSFLVFLHEREARTACEKAYCNTSPLIQTSRLIGKNGIQGFTRLDKIPPLSCRATKRSK